MPCSASLRLIIMATGQSARTEFETPLLNLLNQSDVSNEVREEIKKARCFTVAQFANWVDKREDLFKHFVEPSTVKDDLSQLPRLKMAWRQAEAIYAARLDRTAKGLQEEVVDEPLDDTTQQNIEDAFKNFYHWKDFEPEEIGADTILARFFREFNKWKPSMFALSKIKTVAMTNTGQSGHKRQCGAQGISIFIDVDESEGFNTTELLAVLEALEVLANTWALAGCYESDSLEYPGRFAHWQDTTTYAKYFKKHGTRKLLMYTESSVIKYITECEEEFRRRAIAMIRGTDKVPWGAALMKTIKENRHVIQEKEDILVRRVSLAPSDGGRKRGLDSGPAHAQLKQSKKDSEGRPGALGRLRR